MGIEKHAFLYEQIAEIKECMNSEPKKYSGAANHMGAFAERLARYYHKTYVPLYGEHGVDDGELYRTQKLTARPLVENLKRMGYLKVDYICEKLSKMIDQRNNADHPEINPVDERIVQECYDALDNIINFFVKEYPSDEGYVHPLVGEISSFRIYYNKSKRSKVLTPVCKFDNAVGDNFSYKWYVDNDTVSKDKVCGKGGNTLIIELEYIGKSIKCIVNSKSQDGYIEGEYTLLESDNSKPSKSLAFLLSKSGSIGICRSIIARLSRSL